MIGILHGHLWKRPTPTKSGDQTIVKGSNLAFVCGPCSARKWVLFIMSKDFKDNYDRCKTFLHVAKVRLKIAFDLKYISNNFVPQNYFRKIKFVIFIPFRDDGVKLS